MKVLMISGDKHLLEEGSDAYKRLALQRSQVEQLDVFGYAGVLSGPRGIFEVLSAVMRTKYDVITVQEPFWRGLLGLLGARMSGAKLNLQVHTDLSAQPVWRRVLARFVLRHADSIRVVSERIKTHLTPLHLRGKISVLPIYIDIERFKSIVRAPNAGPKHILWVGRFEKEKDPELALSILKQVRATGIDARLVFLGAGSLEMALRAKARILNLEVEFPGWQDIAKYLATAGVVLSTSRHESYGASIIEALAAGVPVVAPDVGVAREAGAIVVAREKLAEAVIEALKTGATGELKLKILSAEEWAKAWKETLV